MSPVMDEEWMKPGIDSGQCIEFPGL